MVAIIALIYPFVCRYYGLPLSWRFQAELAAINFAFVVPFLWLANWLKRKRETWDSTTSRRFTIAMLTLAILFLSFGIFLLFSR